MGTMTALALCKTPTLADIALSFVRMEGDISSRVSTKTGQAHMTKLSIKTVQGQVRDERACLTPREDRRRARGAAFASCSTSGPSTRRLLVGDAERSAQEQSGSRSRCGRQRHVVRRLESAGDLQEFGVARHAGGELPSHATAGRTLGSIRELRA